MVETGLSIYSVPFAASLYALLSVSFGDNRRSDSVGQGRLRALCGHSRRVVVNGRYGQISGRSSII
jgi:hypothetical protein